MLKRLTSAIPTSGERGVDYGDVPHQSDVAILRRCASELIRRHSRGSLSHSSQTIQHTIMRLRLFAASALLAPTVLAAQSSSQHRQDLSIGVRFGTLGIGPEVNKLVAGHLGVRVGANFFSYHTTRDQSDVSFDATFKLKAVTGLIDLYPKARHGFHFTVGVASNPLEFTGVGKPSGSSYEINGVTYTAAQVGVLNGSAKFPSTLPYVGLGFGTPANSHHGVKFVFDIGAAIGKPTVLLTATNPANSSQLTQNVRDQQTKTQNDVNKYAKVYPALTFGLVFAF